ncbi:MAG: VanZ family protein [Betaproteobacteria bacterium]
MTFLPQRPSFEFAVRVCCLTAALAITINMFWLGAKPVAVNLIPAPWDKLAHFAVFSTLTVLVWIGTGGRMPVTAIVAVVALGALDELHQGTLPGRSADIMDFLTDLLAGTLTGSVLYMHARMLRNGEDA